MQINNRCWYGIPTAEDKLFDRLASKTFPEAAKDCKEFLRHKTYLINPVTVKQNNITIHKCIQYPGEFVITFCGSYHSGFNMGYNCAEAVNFALNRWVNLGKSAGVCKCHSDNVKIDMNAFVDNINPKKSNSSKKKEAKKTKASDSKNKYDNWLKCDDCEKWRRIPKSKINSNTDEKLQKFDDFSCEMLTNLDCKVPEENWRKKYTTVKSKKK
jgi:hypothetical protein